MSKYKIVEKNQFVYIADTSRRGDKIAIALNLFDKILVSQAYTPFQIKDNAKLHPEYLMMWFRRPEFDRYARFKSHGSAREIFDWNEMCEVMLPVPAIEKQREIVAEYNAVQNRIDLNNKMIQKLEETAQAIYREWFVEGVGEDCDIGDLFIPKKGTNITRENAVLGSYPVVAGGLEPSCYHNSFNTDKPVVTISASGANAGFVRLYNTNVWAGDCSYVDKHVFNEVYFAYIALKINQILLMSKQEGTGQPHIYPEHIVTIPVSGYCKEKSFQFNGYCEKVFYYVSRKEIENHKLEELKELLLSKLAK